MGKRCTKCNYVNKDELEICSLCSEVLPLRSNVSEPMHEEPRMLTKRGPQSRHKRMSDDRVHTLVPFNGDAINLDPGVRFVIGRHKNASLPVQGESISRQHAEIIWTKDDPPVPRLRDIRSRNQTFLNNQPVDADEGVELRPGDVIRLGESFAAFYQHSKPHEIEKWIAEDLRLDDTGPIQLPKELGGGGSAAPPERASGPAAGASVSGFAGRLEVLDPTRLFLLLENLSSSGTVTIGDRDEGQILIRSGHPVRADYAGLQGADAILAMAELTAGAFRFEPGGAR